MRLANMVSALRLELHCAVPRLLATPTNQPFPQKGPSQISHSMFVFQAEQKALSHTPVSRFANRFGPMMSRILTLHHSRSARKRS
ncbi:hypothetical protein HOY80DRAFT_648529 [Tuber brumale]|nr:hypothetical protein HOY80DRAFT_648529 [Tuber brumale]